MVRAARVVEHLRLRAESESAVRHSLLALEDAFRTASLPDAGARLICVRRLHLGQIAANASPHGVARQIEQRFAAAGWRVVHAGDASGHDAPAVWFRDAFEAHEIAALRLATGRPLDAWFWPLVLPGVMAQPSEQRLRATALAIAATEEAPSALPAWTASLVRAGHRNSLIAALRPGDGHALLRAAGVRPVPIERARTAVGRFTLPSTMQLMEAPQDDRAAYVEAIVNRPGGRPAFDRPSDRAAREPASALEGSLRHSTGEPLSPALSTGSEAQGDPPPGAARSVARRMDVEQQTLAPCPPHGEPASDPIGGHDTTKEAGAQASGAVANQRGEHGSSQERAARDTRDELETGQNDRTSAGTGEELLSPWHIPHAAPTSAGGLLFLLPVLEQVGFAKWAAERAPQEPEPEILAAEILHLLLSRLRVAEDDPVWELVAAFRLKPEATGELEGSEVAEMWVTACRRFLRRRVRIGLSSLVIRPARLAMTNTHVDVFFRLTAADLRIRRAGLDIDPGWVPWFKRVVSFHYEDRPWN